MNGAEGLEPFPPNIEKQGGNTVNSHGSKMPGAQAGAIVTGSDSVASLKRQALEDLQRAWKSVRRMETLADDPAEAKIAERALAFVDNAFAELEGDKR